VSEDRNFATSYPALAAEWGERNDAGPEKYTPKSNRKVWWICNNPACGREWEATIGSRVAGSGCPGCSIAKRSKVEIWIAFELAQVLPDIDPRANPTVRIGARTYHLDVVLDRELKVAFEYDGRRFHVGQEEKDLKRTRALARAGWKVIHAREHPLEPLNEYSIVVDGQRAWWKPHEVAQAVLRQTRDRCGLALTAEAERYLDATAPTSREEADAFIATKRVPAWTRRRHGTTPATPAEVQGVEGEGDGG
jgi:hypothetical protein